MIHLSSKNNSTWKWISLAKIGILSIWLEFQKPTLLPKASLRGQMAQISTASVRPTASATFIFTSSLATLPLPFSSCHSSILAIPQICPTILPQNLGTCCPLSNSSLDTFEAPSLIFQASAGIVQ
jgi:hypothetical protein